MRANLKKTVSALFLLAFSAVFGPSAFEAGKYSIGPSESCAATREARREITDSVGRKVTLPDEINRVVISSIWPLPSVYCLFEGSAKKLVGIHPASMSAAQNSMLARVTPDILKASTGFTKGNDINMEELLKLRPDVVFYAPASEGETDAEYEQFKAAGIPAVAFSTFTWNFDCVKTFENWVKLLGEVLQRQDEAAGIAAYGHEAYENIQKTFAANPGMKKPKVLILFEYKDGFITTSGSNFFGQYWIESSGGINVASGLSGMPEINMEQVYQWDPDIIFITNFSPALPEDLLENKIEGHDWRGVSAVKNGKVYKFPLGMYRWFPPSSDTPLALKWLAQKTHPDLFPDMDMEKEVLDYYERFYKVKLTDDDLYKIFHPAREASQL
ncbi:MAG: ABC transporter substrate-binding protein [Synergistaceae bacterium]|jgi:iron complex transport system substrate-binding protein|nr:ABC transporter substrate-binding protein [Synergistaceae bacterium]